MGEEQPSLGQLIWLVRRELEWAYGVDAKNPLRFAVGSVELDVTVEATKITKGGAGLDLKVMGVGASGDLSRECLRDEFPGSCGVDAAGYPPGGWEV
jgi:Trypsin-co-occurring domain 2